MKNILRSLVLVIGIVLLAGNASAYTFAECVADQGVTDSSTFMERLQASQACQYVIEENMAAMRERIEAITAATEIFQACMAEADGNAIDCLAEAGIIDIKAIIQERIAELQAEIAARIEATQTCIMSIDFMSLEKEQRQAAIQQCLSNLSGE